MNTEELLKAIEQERQTIWPTDTGKMAPSTVPTDLEQGWLNALTWMERYIKSLPAEQPSEELEREIKLYQLRNPVINHQEKSLNDLVKRVAIYFTQWQKEQILKNSVAVDIWESSFSGECYIHNKAILDDLINRACQQGETVRIAIIKETTNYAERD